MTRASEAFWLLTEPFDERPDVRFLVPTRSARAALEALNDALAKRPGWVCVTGAPGVGKSVLMHLFLESLPEAQPVAVVADAGAPLAELRSEIEAQLAGDDRTVSRAALVAANRAGHRPVVVLDGAETLSAEVAEALERPFVEGAGSGGAPRLLVDFVAVTGGHGDTPEPHWAAARGAPAVRLEPLDAAETAEYVRRRVRIAAGGERELFDAGALDEVFRHTRGRPEAINRVCGLALDRVAAQGGGHISAEDVRDAAERLGDLAPEVDAALALGRPALPDPTEAADAVDPVDADRDRPRPHRVPPAPSDARANVDAVARAPVRVPTVPERPPEAPRAAAREIPHATPVGEPRAQRRPAPAERPEALAAPVPARSGTSPWVVVASALVGSLIGGLVVLWGTGRLAGPPPAPAPVVELPATAMRRASAAREAEGETRPEAEAETKAETEAEARATAQDETEARAQDDPQDEADAEATRARRGDAAATADAEIPESVPARRVAGAGGDTPAAAPARAPQPPADAPADDRPSVASVPLPSATDGIVPAGPDAPRVARGPSALAPVTTGGEPARLPDVSAAPPTTVVPEGPPPPRVPLPLRDGPDVLDAALADRAPAGVAWRVRILSPDGGGAQVVEHADVAHAEVDGRLQTLAVLAGDGPRRPARLLDRSHTPGGESVRVFFPDERVVRTAAVDDPFAGTGFRYDDFLPLRAADFEVTRLEGDQLEGQPIFVVTARPLHAPEHERVEVWIRERDLRLLEWRAFEPDLDDPVRRVVVTRPEAGTAGGAQAWRVYGPGGRPVARAEIVAEPLPADLDAATFTFSRLSDPAFAIPTR